MEKRTYRAEIIHVLRRLGGAFALFAAVANAHPGNPFQGPYMMGAVAASMGDTALALEIDGRMRMEAWPPGPWGPHHFALYRAWIHARLGNLEEAFELLESVYFEHGRYFYDHDHTFFDLLPLQGYPPYDELMRDAG